MRTGKGFVLLAVLIIVACGEKKSSSPLIAKVGKSELYLDEVQEFLPTETSLSLSKVQVQNFVQRWTEKELVYAEARQQGFHENAEIQKELHRLQRDFLVASFLEKMTEQNLEISEQEISQYYQEKSQEYIRPTDQYHLKVIMVKTYSDANDIRRQIRRGLEFEAAAKEYSLEKHAVENGDWGWVTLDELPASRAGQVPRLKIGAHSNPIKTEIGYALIKVDEKRNKGEVQTLEEIRDTVIWRLQVRKREQLYRKLISRISENMDVETNWSVIDSAFSHIPE